MLNLHLIYMHIFFVSIQDLLVNLVGLESLVNVGGMVLQDLMDGLALLGNVVREDHKVKPDCLERLVYQGQQDQLDLEVNVEKEDPLDH